MNRKFKGVRYTRRPVKYSYKGKIVSGYNKEDVAHKLNLNTVDRKLILTIKGDK